MAFRTTLRRFVDLAKAFGKDTEGQDMLEYGILLGALAVVAAAVIPDMRNAIINAFRRGISAINMAGGR